MNEATSEVRNWISKQHYTHTQAYIHTNTHAFRESCIKNEQCLETPLSPTELQGLIRGKRGVQAMVSSHLWRPRSTSHWLQMCIVLVLVLPAGTTLTSWLIDNKVPIEVFLKHPIKEVWWLSRAWVQMVSTENYTYRVCLERWATDVKCFVYRPSLLDVQNMFWFHLMATRLR